MDINLNYIEKGSENSGDPIVFLHGNSEDSSYFKKQIEYFGSKYHVIALDTRGHGKSPRGSAPFTLKQFAEDLKEFLDKKGIRRVTLLGFSDGGNIALLFSLKYPQYVSKLILNGANLRPAGIRLIVQIPIVLGYAVTVLLSPFSKKAVQNREMLGLMVNQPHIEPEQLKSITCPVLVIAGLRDMVRDSHTRYLAKCIPNASLTIISGDHYIAMKRSDPFNCEVEKFLSKM